VAVLAGALAKSIGFPVRLMAVALDGRPVFGHVWAEARNRQGQWVDFDVTRSAQGLERARITRVLPMRVP
jgi:transglutaminase-like putative cysteine protease